MERKRRMRWWTAVPVGLALGLDRAAAPAGAQSPPGITVSAQQLHINQRISQQGVRRANRANARLAPDGDRHPRARRCWSSRG